MAQPGRQLAYPETRCREDLTNVVALIHLGFLDAKDYPQIGPNLEIRPPPEKDMTTKEKIVFYSLCFIIFAGLGVGIFYIASPCSFVINLGKFQCRDIRFSANLYCAPDYTESKSNYCDECGFVDTKDQNNPASWPFLVLIKFEYIWDQTISDNSTKQSSKVKMSKQFFCTGTIIDRYSIATSPYCIRKTFNFTYDDNVYLVQAVPNNYQASIMNMITVYGGIKKGLNLTDQLIDTSNMESYFETKFNVDGMKTNNNNFHLFTTSWAMNINERMSLGCYHLFYGSLEFPLRKTGVLIASWSSPINVNPQNPDKSYLKFNWIQSFLLAPNVTHKLYTNDRDTASVYKDYTLNEGDALFEKDPEKNLMLSLIGVYSRLNLNDIMNLRQDFDQNDPNSPNNIFNSVYDEV